MKKQINFIVIFMLVAFCTNAQTFKYDFSKNKRHTTSNINGVAAGDGWLVMQKKFAGKLYSLATIVEIVRYDKNMEKVKTAEITLKASKFIILKGLYAAKGQYNLVYGYKHSRSDEEIQISGIRINPDDLSVINEISLGSVRTSGGYSMLTDERPDDKAFSFHYSIDSSRFYLLGFPQQKKKDPKQYGFVVFNPDLTKLYSRNIELDIQSRYAEIESTTLDQFGNFYVQRRTIPIEIEKSRIDKEESKYVPEESILTHFSKDDPAGKQVLLGLSGKYVYQTRLTMNKNSNTLSIAGSYKSDEKGKITGIFYCEYDPATRKSSGLLSSEIPTEVIDVLANEKLATIKGKFPGLSLAFNIHSVSYRPNGSIDCIMEYDNPETRTSQGMGGVLVEYVKYFSNSILNVNIGSDGKMIFTRVPKRQVDAGSGLYRSFFPFYRGNNLVLLYNDLVKNLDKDIQETPKEMDPDKKGSALIAATVDEKGNLKREIIYQHDKAITLANSARLVSHNEILLAKDDNTVGVLHVN